MANRKNIPVDTKTVLLTESGYRCANPACRFILTIELHHIVPVSENGSNDPSNLLPLCSNCHQMYTKGYIQPESIRAWKVLLVSLSNAFDKKAIDIMLMLSKFPIVVTGDGILECSSLISSGLIHVTVNMTKDLLFIYTLSLTEKGQFVIQAWKNGDLSALDDANQLAKLNNNV